MGRRNQLEPVTALLSRLVKEHIDQIMNAALTTAKQTGKRNCVTQASGCTEIIQAKHYQLETAIEELGDMISSAFNTANGNAGPGVIQVIDNERTAAT